VAALLAGSDLFCRRRGDWEGVVMKPLAWPDDRSEYWWMEFKQKPRGKPERVLGTMTEAMGVEFFSIDEDTNAFSRSMCEEWQARFLPAETPPTFPERVKP
jgi:hypothetical protein